MGLQTTVRRVAHRADHRLYRKYRGDTLLNEAQFVDNLLLLRRVTASGDLVECGVWRAGMSAAMAEVLPGRRSVLFDSFEGLPTSGQRDDGNASQAGDYAASEEAARATMMRSGGAFESRAGWFDDTVPKYAAETPTIAVLRLDADLYDSTMVCLTHPFPLVAPGGLVIIDDYGGWVGCTRAVHDYLSSEQRTEGIRTTPRFVAYLKLG